MKTKNKTIISYREIIKLLRKSYHSLFHSSGVDSVQSQNTDLVYIKLNYVIRIRT